MDRPEEDRNCRVRGAGSLRRLGLVGLGLCVMGGVAGAGCGVGTDPALWAGADAAVGAPDGDASSSLPDGVPPLDKVTYENTAIATFALG
jgi:hypothetical protein